MLPVYPATNGSGEERSHDENSTDNRIGAWSDGIGGECSESEARSARAAVSDTGPPPEVDIGPPETTLETATETLTQGLSPEPGPP